MDIYRLIIKEKTGNLSLQLYFDRLPTSDEAKIAIYDELDNWLVEYKEAFLYGNNGELDTLVLPEMSDRTAEMGWPLGSKYYARFARCKLIHLKTESK